MISSWSPSWLLSSLATTPSFWSCRCPSACGCGSQTIDIWPLQPHYPSPWIHTRPPEDVAQDFSIPENPVCTVAFTMTRFHISISPSPPSLPICSSTSSKFQFLNASFSQSVNTCKSSLFLTSTGWSGQPLPRPCELPPALAQLPVPKTHSTSCHLCSWLIPRKPQFMSLAQTSPQTPDSYIQPRFRHISLDVL